MALNPSQPPRVPSASVISLLHDKPAASWEKKIRELEDEKNFRVLEYLPLRKAIIAELGDPGSGAATLLHELEDYNSGFATDAMIQVMKEGFALFMAKQRKHFTELYSENVNRPAPYLVKIGGGEARVTLHAEVEHARYGQGSLYIYASQYSPKEANALQELVGMVPEQRDNGSPGDVFWLDIRKGSIARLKSRSSVRSNVADAVRLYNRLF